MEGSMFRSIVVAMATLALSAAPVSSARIFGHGLSSCGKWTDVRRSQSPDNIAHASWAIGYLSGINQVISAYEKKDILIRQDAQALLAWLDNYCRANPLETVGKALDLLTDELVKRAGLLK
jgi:hypothetical protein